MAGGTLGGFGRQITARRLGSSAPTRSALHVCGQPPIAGTDGEVRTHWHISPDYRLSPASEALASPPLSSLLWLRENRRPFVLQELKKG